LWAQKEEMQNNRWGLPEKSKISPVDACKYLGIENIIFVREFGKPEPSEYEKYAESFKELKKVVWSVVGAVYFFSRMTLLNDFRNRWRI